MDLSGKVVLITGGGGGIGREVALLASKKGARLLLCGRRQAVLDEAKSLMPAEAQVAVVQADVTTKEGRAAIKAALQAAYGELDVLINNAGTLTMAPLESFDDEALEHTLDVNLLAPMALTRDLLPLLEKSTQKSTGKKKAGKNKADARVVNIGSMFGDLGFPLVAPYAASKFGLRGFSDALRRELAPRGIGVTYVAPRATQTGMTASYEALVEPTAMTVDPSEKIGAMIVSAIERDARSAYVNGIERIGVAVQRIFPALMDKIVQGQMDDDGVRAYIRSFKGEGKSPE